MLFYRDFQLEWIARGQKVTRDYTTQPLSTSYWDLGQKQANLTGRIVTVYELRHCRWNNTLRRKRLCRVRPTTKLRFERATDPLRERASDSKRRRMHRNAERAGQLILLCAWNVPALEIK